MAPSSWAVRGVWQGALHRGAGRAGGAAEHGVAPPAGPRWAPVPLRLEGQEGWQLPAPALRGLGGQSCRKDLRPSGEGAATP